MMIDLRENKGLKFTLVLASAFTRILENIKLGFPTPKMDIAATFRSTSGRFNPIYVAILLGFTATSLTNAEPLEAAKTASVKAPAKPLKREDFSRILWTDLMPEDDLAALLNPPDYLAAIQDGSAEDQIGASVGNGDDRYQQALVSTRVIEAMDGQAIKIPGFVVPVEFDDDQVITQFFLVPYFGACIHEPPPPPNQIIFVNSPEGIQVNALYDPFWISGVIHTEEINNGLATAAYTMSMHFKDPYLED